MNDWFAFLVGWQKINSVWIQPKQNTWFSSPKSCSTKITCEPEIQLKLADVAISKVDNFKFLGVIVLKNLSWKAHMLCGRNKFRACLALTYKQGCLNPGGYIPPIIWVWSTSASSPIIWLWCASERGSPPEFGKKVSLLVA